LATIRLIVSSFSFFQRSSLSGSGLIDLIRRPLWVGWEQPSMRESRSGRITLLADLSKKRAKAVRPPASNPRQKSL